MNFSCVRVMILFLGSSREHEGSVIANALAGCISHLSAEPVLLYNGEADGGDGIAILFLGVGSEMATAKIHDSAANTSLEHCTKSRKENEMNGILQTAIACMIYCVLSLTATSPDTIPHDMEKHFGTALQAVIEEEKVTEHALNDIDMYPWSDNIEDDILMLRTLVNNEEDIYCYQFCATDRIRVWIGTAFIRAADGEILDASVEYLFTSGVTPFMSLMAGMSKDIIEFNPWGKFTVIQRTTDFDDFWP